MNVGAPEEPVALNLFSLIGGRKTLAGSMIGGIPETQEMLDFCAEHGLGAEIELISADQINEAYERVAGQRRPLPLRDRHGDDLTRRAIRA